MFKGIHFLVHDSVPGANSVAMTIQDHGGRISFAVTAADVIVVDKTRCSLQTVLAEAPCKTELVDYTWVAACVQHGRGRRLAYTYHLEQADDETSSSSTVAQTEAAPTFSSAPATNVDTPHDAEGPVETIDIDSAGVPQYTGILPLPPPSVLSFVACGWKHHPPQLKDYFAAFLTAMWTLDPSLRRETIAVYLHKTLPHLSVWSLDTFTRANEKRVKDARTNGAAGHRAGVSAGTTVDDEMKKLMKAVTAMRSAGAQRRHAGEPGYMRSTGKTGANHSPPPIRSRVPKSTQPRGNPKCRWLDGRIGSSTIRALLDAPDLPALPNDSSVESKNAFFDELLRWVLRREPTASKVSINALVYEMGGRKTFTERAFETGYKTRERLDQYHRIRDDILGRWRSGELGTLSEADDVEIARLHGRRRKEQQVPPSLSEHSHGVATRSSVSGGNGTPTPSFEPLVESGSAFGPRTPHPASLHDFPNVHLTPAFGAADTRIRQPGGDGARQDDDDDELDDGKVDSDDVPENTASGTLANAEQALPTPTVCPEMNEEEIIQELAKCMVWLEDYVAEHELDATSGATKRASIWEHMAIKYNQGTIAQWKEFYEFRKVDIERRVQDLRAQHIGSEQHKKGKR